MDVCVVLGTGSTCTSVSPACRVELGDEWRAIQAAAGERHSLVLAQRKFNSIPFLLNPIHQLRCIFFYHSRVVGFDEGKLVTTVFAMGSNEYGQCGVLPSQMNKREEKDDEALRPRLVLSPREVHPIASAAGRVVKIACGALHSLLLTDVGRVFSFGWNGYRQRTAHHLKQFEINSSHLSFLM
jgi:hypothetical protein